METFIELLRLKLFLIPFRFSMTITDFGNCLTYSIIWFAITWSCWFTLRLSLCLISPKLCFFWSFLLMCHYRPLWRLISSLRHCHSLAFLDCFLRWPLLRLGCAPLSVDVTVSGSSSSSTYFFKTKWAYHSLRLTISTVEDQSQRLLQSSVSVFHRRLSEG